MREDAQGARDRGDQQAEAGGGTVDEGVSEFIAGTVLTPTPLQEEE